MPLRNGVSVLNSGTSGACICQEQSIYITYFYFILFPSDEFVILMIYEAEWCVFEYKNKACVKCYNNFLNKAFEGINHTSQLVIVREAHLWDRTEIYWLATG